MWSRQAKPDDSRGEEGGFVPVAVPCHGGVDAVQNDISWTSGFPAAMRMLNLFYGSKVNATSASTDERFHALRAWVNGQVWNASANGSLPQTDGLPDFSVCVRENLPRDSLTAHSGSGSKLMGCL